ncbi:hypothetical protein HanIR_MTg0917321 (mitochondrion) [Helianthus annuus]|nr:hypothetical protein HanIR_MTg0917321 [Helianthus annuus]
MALWSPSILLVGRFVRARVNPPSTENHEKQYWLKDRLWNRPMYGLSTKL